MVNYSRIWGECMRCGFNRRLSELATEWTGLKVCRDTCWDPKPAELRPPPVKPEGVPVPGAAPQTEPIFRSSGGLFDPAIFDPAIFDTGVGADL